MKIRGIILFLVIGLSGQLSAQEMQGKVRYLVVHNWSKKFNSCTYISQQSREKASYMWGNEEGWKDYTELYFSQTASKYQDSEEKAMADAVGYNWRMDVYAIHRNFEQMRIHDHIQTLGKIYSVEDTLILPQWKILNDMKEVAGHICMNARLVDTVKQQTIMAWFALDMPSSAGPERWCGLPGLILEVDVNDGAMVLTADKIEMIPVADQLEFPKKKQKGKKVSEAEYQEVIRNYIDDRKKAEEPWFWGIRY